MKGLSICESVPSAQVTNDVHDAEEAGIIRKRPTRALKAGTRIQALHRAYFARHVHAVGVQHCDSDLIFTERSPAALG